MDAIRRVIFTGDILRPFPRSDGGFESATVKNIRWLRHLIGWQLDRATPLPQDSVSWESRGFDTPAFYAGLGLDLTMEAWASVFYAEELSIAASQRLAAPFVDALVIGVELPDVLQNALARHGIPFVDLVAHPVRFMDDVLLACRTNIPSAHTVLLQRAFDLDRCRPYANLHRAKAAWMPPLDLPPGTALLTGQVATDKAVIDRRSGRFLHLGDFTEQLFEICEIHPLVLYKPHPYQGSDCPSLRVVRSFRSIRQVNENFYYLMGQEAITDVYAISSGTVHEAPFFGKRGHAFADPLYEFGHRPPEGGRPGACVPIGEDFLAPEFWANLLSELVPIRASLPPGPAPRASRLRRSLNADWDHGFIDAVVQAPRHLERPAAEPTEIRA